MEMRYQPCEVCKARGNDNLINTHCQKNTVGVKDFSKEFKFYTCNPGELQVAKCGYFARRHVRYGKRPGREAMLCVTCNVSDAGGIQHKKCGKCHQAYYCSVDCQRKDHKNHISGCFKYDSPFGLAMARAAAALDRMNPTRREEVAAINHDETSIELD